jgi:hypothetical protein
MTSTSDRCSLKVGFHIPCSDKLSIPEMKGKVKQRMMNPKKETKKRGSRPQCNQLHWKLGYFSIVSYVNSTSLNLEQNFHSK